jgi:hypothetical protein
MRPCSLFLYASPVFLFLLHPGIAAGDATQSSRAAREPLAALFAAGGDAAGHCPCQARIDYPCRQLYYSELAPTPQAVTPAAPAYTWQADKAKKTGVLTLAGAGRWVGYSGLAEQLSLQDGDLIRIAYSPFSQAATVRFSLQFYGGETVQVTQTSTQDSTAGGATVAELRIAPKQSGNKLCAVWLEINHGGPGEFRVELKTFTVIRRNLDTRLDADAILATPSRHASAVKNVGGTMSFTIDGEPVTGIGCDSICPQNVSDRDLQDMLGKTGFKMTRMTFCLGESIYGLPYAPTWLGPNRFDWAPLDEQLDRLLRANAKLKILIKVDLDGAKWWTLTHPQASLDIAKGIPDFLSPEWRQDTRRALRQLVAHVQATPRFNDAVVGYVLFNGPSLDCSYEVSLNTPPAKALFQNFLRLKYPQVTDLRQAWADATVTFETAVAVETTPEKWADPRGKEFLIIEPKLHQRLLDTRDFQSWAINGFTLDFARTIKQATQGRALVGARSGELLVGSWAGSDLAYSRINCLRQCPDLDFIDQWEPYPGRGLGHYGSGAPASPPQGLALDGKLFNLQNDVRPHGGPDLGYGATATLAETIAKQKRVFTNALVMGMSPYLWQMSYNYNDPNLLPFWRQCETVFKKATALERGSGAELVYVTPDNFVQLLGFETVYQEPTRGFALVDFPRFLWARAGMPYDMIFLDQLATAKAYKIYVFFHCLALSEQDIKNIHQVLAKNHAAGVFLWADGVVDADTGELSEKQLRKLTGIEIKMSTAPTSWEMTPTAAFAKQAGLAADYPMGTLRHYDVCDLAASKKGYAPAFSITDPKADILARRPDGTPGIALKSMPGGWTSVYSASPNLPPCIVRFLATKVGAHIFTDAEEISYIANSFIGFHVGAQPKPIHVSLPAATALYEVFTGEAWPAAKAFTLQVPPFETRLYFKGDKAAWESLP